MVELVLLIIAASSPQSSAKPPAPLTFEKHIRPILVRACFDCHGDDNQEAQLDLRTVTSILQGGENGHGIVRGAPDRSILLDMVVRQQMPPEDEEKLSAREIELIRRWIKEGAPTDQRVVELPPRTSIAEKDRSFWAFRTPTKQPLPSVKGIDRTRTAIDRFVLQRLEANGLGYSPDADKVTLLRRAYFNLIGLPPEPSELDAFLADEGTDAWERLVDRLLASPHYGERWGRHWLDAVGYVDNRLFDGDLATIYPNEGIWRYRDYVIGSFDQDKPYDRFITEQLAGDELVDWRNADVFTSATRDLLTATGFFRSIEDHTSEPQYGIDKRYEVVFDTMEMMSTSLLGLTMHCCRCHNHKFDPIPQRDYFRLMATIEPALNPRQWLKPQDRWLPDVGSDERQRTDQHNTRVDKQVSELGEQIKLAQAAKDDTKVRWLKSEITRLSASKRNYGKLQALWDTGEPPKSRVLRRGQVHAPGTLIEPGFLEVLSTPQTTRAVRPKETAGSSSGMRLALANWLTGRKHPLTARVIVNRVWHHHFGRGLVATTGNFGRSGSPPTHPELLDWLAVEFMERGWSIKRLHRLIMTSTVFRQASNASPETDRQAVAKIDPDNNLFWRMNIRRLEAEIIRDAVLAVSGRLDTTQGGPPVMITKPSNGLSREEKEPTPTSHERRSLYLFARRVYPLKFLEVFDVPIMAVNCTRRSQSATVLQSFTQLNDEFVVNRASQAAIRALANGDGPTDQVLAAWRIVLSRPPDEFELKRCGDFLREQQHVYGEDAEGRQKAFADLCHMLMCTNEFLYVE